MSYILEALKKAEQKREQEEPSKVPTFLVGPVRDSGRHVRWPYVVAAAIVVFLNAILVIWHFIPSRAPHQTPSSVQTASPVQAPARAESPPVAPVIIREPSKTVRKYEAPASPRKSTPVFVVSGEPAKSAPAPEAAPIPETRVERAQPRTGGKIFSLAELPPAIRNALPQFRVSGHAYTPEPRTRVVRINEKILQEGQELSPGLKVEEIVQGGIIMSYGGYRFRVDIDQSS
jgi:general secretion pathway protein B